MVWGFLPKMLSCHYLYLLYIWFWFPFWSLLIRQQHDSDLNRQQRMKSEPLNLHKLLIRVMIISGFCCIRMRGLLHILEYFLWCCIVNKNIDVWLQENICNDKQYIIYNFRCQPKICIEELDGRVCYKKSWDKWFFWGLFTNNTNK